MVRIHTAMESKGGVANGGGILEETYKGNGLTVLQHDICKGPADEFRNADALFTIISWRAGYKKYTAGTVAEDTNWVDYLNGIRRTILELGVPAFIVCHQSALKHLRPDIDIPIHYKLFDCTDRLAIWNYYAAENMNMVEGEELNEENLMEWIVKNNDVILDPCCGYGQLADVIIRQGKQGILSDINVECLKYINEEYCKR